MSRTIAIRSSIAALAVAACLGAGAAQAQDQALPPTPDPAPPAATAPAAKPRKPPPTKATADTTKQDEAGASDAAPPGDTPTGSPSYVETVPAAEAAGEAAPEAEVQPTAPRRPPRRAPPARRPMQAYPPPPPGYGGPAWPSAPPPPPRTERRSTGMMVTGIVLTSLGGVGLVAAGVLIAEANDEREVCLGGACNTVDEGKRNAGIGIGVAALASLGAGIPLLIVGARKVPVQEPAAAMPRLELGPGGARACWSF